MFVWREKIDDKIVETGVAYKYIESYVDGRPSFTDKSICEIRTVTNQYELSKNDMKRFKHEYQEWLKTGQQ